MKLLLSNLAGLGLLASGPAHAQESMVVTHVLHGVEDTFDEDSTHTSVVVGFTWRLGYRSLPIYRSR